LPRSRDRAASKTHLRSPASKRSFETRPTEATTSALNGSDATETVSIAGVNGASAPEVRIIGKLRCCAWNRSTKSTSGCTANRSARRCDPDGITRGKYLELRKMQTHQGFKHWQLAILTALLAGTLSSAQAGDYSNVYFFGDSLIDNGVYADVIAPLLPTNARFTTNPGTV
jgi:hypothetical protein